MKRTICLLAAVLPLAAQVSYERLRQADSEPANWLTYSGNYSAQRYSGLNQITPANVRQLRPVWVYQMQTTERVEASPLVADGMMYVSEPGGSVTALDTLTGRPLWKYVRTVAKGARGCCGQVNRGVAILNDMVYVGTFDSHLVALDIKSGIVRWDAEVAEPKLGHSITAAPLALKDKILVGIAGGEYGIRGFVDAYDAKTGQRAWRFWTVPAAGEPGSETWSRRLGKNRRSHHVGYRRLRSGAKHRVLGHGQSGAGLEWRRASGEQSLLRLFAGPGWRHRQIEVVFPVHSA